MNKRNSSVVYIGLTIIVVILISASINWLLAQGFNAFQQTTFTSVTTGTTLVENTVIGFNQLTWTVSGTVSTCTVSLDSSVDGVSWTVNGIITGQTCTSNGNSVVTAGSANFMRVNMQAISGAGATVVVTYKGWVVNPSGSSFTGGTITTPIQGADGTCAGGPTYSFSGATTTGLSRATTNLLGCIGGTAQAAINNTVGYELPNGNWLGWSGSADPTAATVTTIANTANKTISVGTGGDATGAIVTGGYTIGLTATAALTSGQVVKADTANSNAVVVTATTDTGAGIVVGIVLNSPGAAAVAQVATTGRIATPVLGTGTCSIGQFVIVDTTTAGRVQCTSTFTAGTVIGKAITAQASVGSVVSVLVGLR